MVGDVLGGRSRAAIRAPNAAKGDQVGNEGKGTIEAAGQPEEEQKERETMNNEKTYPGEHARHCAACDQYGDPSGVAQWNEGCPGLDSARPEPTGDEVERAARAIYVARYRDESDPEGLELQPWKQIAEWEREDFREQARAAIGALPPSGALELAREMLSYIETSPPRRDEGVERRGIEKARELVALLEKR